MEVLENEITVLFQRHKNNFVELKMELIIVLLRIDNAAMFEYACNSISEKLNCKLS